MPLLTKPSCTLLFIFLFSLLVLHATFRRFRHPATAAVPSRSYRNGLLYRKAFLSSATNSTVATNLRQLTLQPHLAGDLRAAVYVKTQLENLGLETHFTNYSALLSYPKHSSLTARFSDGTTASIPLSEPNVPGTGVVMPYHAYSPSGSAYGKAVFVNYGREEDYNALAVLGVEVKGCVAIVRRGCGLSRSEVVENAAARRVAAVLMYTESEFKEGVERGTVMKDLGDPLSPGWASLDGGEKLAPNDPQVTEKFPTVVSLPVSEAAAKSILRSLEGAHVPFEWRVSLENNDRIRWVGPGPTTLNLTYEGEKRTATIHNVFAIIKGSDEPDRFVLLGNHRDAWTYGAVDPNSGTAALLDIARRYAHLMSSGWNPRRTIILCSWDGEEFGMIGSTEWVEHNLFNLGSKAVAYLNVDCAVQGPGFFASATPQLDDVIVDVMKEVKDPDGQKVTLYESWEAVHKGSNIQRLSGVDSDFAPFLQHAGVPSVDLYYGRDFPVYHTSFDSYDWMIKFGDPLFQRHVSVAGVWGLLALRLADDPVLPFNYVSYATQLEEYKSALGDILEGSISLHPIEVVICEFTTAAKDIESEAKILRESKSTDGTSELRRRILNDRLILAERGFLDSEGLPGRQWFKHLVYGPHGYTESKLMYFPGVLGTITRSKAMDEEKSKAAIQHEIWRVARAIQNAASILKGELT